jgi:hypothetical protein
LHLERNRAEKSVKQQPMSKLSLAADLSLSLSLSLYLAEIISGKSGRAAAEELTRDQTDEARLRK